VLDPVTTVLELGAVALAALGIALAVAAVVGGQLGTGLGLIAAAVVLAVASTVIRWLTVDEDDEKKRGPA
jgi:hypothetical protein